MTLKQLMLAGSAIALTAAPALAGSPEPAPADTVPATPAYTAPASGDWTGGYVGLNLGYADLESGTTEGDGGFYGLSAGYDYDLGDWVIGAGIDYDRHDIAVGALDVDTAVRLKLRAGYDLGDGLIYGTAGAVRLDTNAGDDNGYFVGAGYEHKVTEQVSLGTEVLYNRVDTFNGGSDLEATTIAAKVNFRF